MDIFRESYEREKAAKQLVEGATFEPIEHPYGYTVRKPSWGQERKNVGAPLKAYRVVVGGEVIGTVYQAYESVHKKAGRLIASTRYVLRWSNSPALPASREYLYYDSTRAVSAVAMVERMLKAGCTIKGGKLVAPRVTKGETV